MTLIIRINLGDNAAFEDDLDREMENILKQVCQTITNTRPPLRAAIPDLGNDGYYTLEPCTHPLRDSNGNTVGSVEIVTE